MALMYGDSTLVKRFLQIKHFFKSGTCLNFAYEGKQYNYTNKLSFKALVYSCLFDDFEVKLNFSTWSLIQYILFNKDINHIIASIKISGMYLYRSDFKLDAGYTFNQHFQTAPMLYFSNFHDILRRVEKKHLLSIAEFNKQHDRASSNLYFNVSVIDCYSESFFSANTYFLVCKPSTDYIDFFSPHEVSSRTTSIIVDSSTVYINDDSYTNNSKTINKIKSTIKKIKPAYSSHSLVFKDVMSDDVFYIKSSANLLDDNLCLVSYLKVNMAKKQATMYLSNFMHDPNGMLSSHYRYFELPFASFDKETLFEYYQTINENHFLKTILYDDRNYGKMMEIDFRDFTISDEMFSVVEMLYI